MIEINPKTRFVIGQLGAPFGLEGFVKVRSFSGETGHFLRLEKITVRQNGAERVLDVAETVSRPDSLLMRFAGIENPEAAALLKGAEIVAPREIAAPLKEGEFYVEDLKGLKVITADGRVLGHIADIVEGGGAELAEVELLSGEKRFAPYRNEFFGEVSLEKGMILLLEPWVLE